MNFTEFNFPDSDGSSANPFVHFFLFLFVSPATRVMSTFRVSWWNYDSKRFTETPAGYSY